MMASRGDHEFIGFVGLGHMGGSVARYLSAKNVDLGVHDIRPAPVRELEDLGAQGFKTAKSLSEASTVIAVCVVDDAQVREVVLGDDGVIHGAAAGATVVVHSTIDPETVIELRGPLADCGVGVVDAAVSGDAEKRATGRLTVFVGGDDGDVERVRWYLQMIGSNVSRLGPLGSGLVGKLCNNLMLFGNALCAYEAARLGVEYGISEDALVAATSTGTAGSWVLDHWGWFEALIRDHTLGSVDRVIEFLERDLAYVIGLADKKELEMSFTRHVDALMSSAIRQRLLDSREADLP